jgi:hypothetical protein
VPCLIQLASALFINLTQLRDRKSYMTSLSSLRVANKPEAPTIERSSNADGNLQPPELDIDPELGQDGHTGGGRLVRVLARIPTIVEPYRRRVAHFRGRMEETVGNSNATRCTFRSKNTVVSAA